jgi:hypothetical protein
MAVKFFEEFIGLISDHLRKKETIEEMVLDQKTGSS